MLTRLARRTTSLCAVYFLFVTGLVAAEPLRIVTLGDSITKGVRLGVFAEETYSAELQRNLRDTGYPDCEVINVGVGGETAGQGLRRLGKDVIAKKPQFVTIMYGHNDSSVDTGKTESRVSIPRFRADLSQLVQRLRESNITPILMTPPAYAEKSGPNGIGEHCNVKLAQYAEVTRQVAETLQVPLVDHYAAWAEMSKSGTDLNEWTTDGYHPNPKGHVILVRCAKYDAILSAFARILLWQKISFEIPYGRTSSGLVQFNISDVNEFQRQPGALYLYDESGKDEAKFKRLNNVVHRVWWYDGVHSTEKTGANEGLFTPSAERLLKFSQSPTEWTVELPPDLPLSGMVVIEVDGMPRLVTTPAVSRPGADGVITLSARDAVVHGEKLQFEPLTHKNTVGYWVNPSDYAEWSYALDAPGEFEVEILQGCGGHAGSDVALGFPEGPVPFVVEETGHFQNFVWRKIGRIALKEPGVQVMSLKCQKLAKGAVMDMRQVRLVPVAALSNEPRDMRDVTPDMVGPLPTTEGPTPGRRSILTAAGFEAPGVLHTLYLPTNHSGNQKWPILVEWAGNGPFRNDHGDVSVGRPEAGQLAYGLSGGYGAICVSLPFLSGDGRTIVTQWWGEAPTYDTAATVKYMKAAIAETCEKYHGDPERVILVGFSRGSIAVNAVGLSTDEAAGLWKAAVCFSHYDGVGNWPFPKSDSASAIERLQRLGNKPQFIISESPTEGPALSDQAREFIEKSGVKGDFTFATTGFLNHSDQWALRPSPARTQVREWLQKQYAEK